MSDKFDLKNARKVRRNVTIKNQKYVRDLYKDLYKEVSKEIKRKEGTLAGLRNKDQLMGIQRSLKREIKKLDKSITSTIESGVKETSSAIVRDADMFLKRIGFKDYNSAYSGVPHEVVRNVLTGNIYAGQISGKKRQVLSKRVWNITEKNAKDINKIVARGIALNKDIYEIAKDLERYVNPSERKDFKWSRMYPGTDRVVDYNAQRLARTMVSHAYWQSFKNVCDDNPFIVAYRWLTADIHGRTCEVCRHRAYDDHHGLGPGVYPKDELPIDHPNGFCDFEPIIPRSLRSMSDEISDWYVSPEGTYPELDEYARQLKELKNMS